MSENRIVKAENLLLASNILVLYKGYNLQIVKSSVASFLSSDFKKRKKENTQSSIIPPQKVYVRQNNNSSKKSRNLFPFYIYRIGMILKKYSYCKKSRMLAGKRYQKHCVIISSGRKILTGTIALSYT